MPPSVYLYALAVLVLAGGGFYGGYHMASRTYQLRADALQGAQDKAVADAQARVIAAQSAQAQASAQAEKDYAELKDSNDTLATQLTDSLRRYTQAREHPVPTASGAPAQPPGTGPFAPGDSALTELAGLAGQACLEDAAELTALQGWARGIAK